MKDMVSKSHAKRRQDIKTKLMAAVAMLLVSSIMMVSTTYAWFTLSTAPEVTGISTQVGANGNLEMALLPENGLDATEGNSVANDFGITSGTGDSGADATIKNNTWGNIVDLGSTPDIKSFYGLDRIVLYPSALNAGTLDANGNPETLAEALLKTPTYGVDGRMSDLVANTVTSTYVENNTNFPQNNLNGVRAVGAASGMTDRQIDYRNYRSSASSAMTQAKREAGAALSNRGSGLANIVLAHAVDANALHTQNDVDNLIGLCNDLLAENGAFASMEKAYRDYIIATVASAANTANDEAVNTLIATLESKTTLNDVIAALDTLSIDGLDNIKSKITQLNNSKKTVTDALEKLTALNTTDGGEPRGDDISWGEITAAMGGLADTEAMKVNGKTAEDIKDDMGGFASSAIGGGGIVVSMASGGGVFADIADHCGDYEATIYINGNFNGIPLEDFRAKMETQSAVSSYLPAIGSVVTGLGAPSSAGGQLMPISDFYGYVIDLAFRTNASSSNLLLQTTPVDRIYDDNHNPETMGGGSTMTFTSTTTDFTTDQMVGLMEAIRVVFFDPLSKEVFATAKLDMGKDGGTPRYTVGTTDVTANLYLYEVTGDTTSANYEAASAEQITAAKNGTEGAKKLYTLSEGTYSEVTDASTITDDGEYFVEVVTTIQGGENFIIPTDEVKAEITALTQNTAKAVSVLVYLDGAHITNADVAATAATSMTGSFNLQFASSADLVPMEYGQLIIEESEVTEVNVTVNKPENVNFTGNTTANKGENYVFSIELPEDCTNWDDFATKYTVTMKIGDEEENITEIIAMADGEGEIPMNDITDDITITVTAAP